MEELKRLSEINVGQTAEIASIENDDIFLKLMEMGCVPGEIITVQQTSLFRDPISITVSGYVLSLRKDEAKYIIVKNIK
ncbi:MAG: FeoA family protein [Ferruginibacter sp.]